MKTSNWIVAACLVVCFALGGLMLGFWRVPTTETETTTETSTSVSGSGSAARANERENLLPSVDNTQGKTVVEFGGNEDQKPTQAAENYDQHENDQQAAEAAEKGVEDLDQHEPETTEETAEEGDENSNK